MCVTERQGAASAMLVAQSPKVAAPAPAREQQRSTHHTKEHSRTSPLQDITHRSLEGTLKCEGAQEGTEGIVHADMFVAQ